MTALLEFNRPITEIMTMSHLKTRFAPSPTGYLHIGGARTALFCYLYAKKHQGEFCLRIEDTDRERSTQTSIQAILDAMTWLGLDYDGEPTYQTNRFDRYSEVIQQMLNEGKAYRCYCSKERLENLREQQMMTKQKPRYDGCCRELSEQRDEPYVIRFKNPDKGDVTFHDFIRGEITVSNAELDDLIIARTDGTPTYNFTVVVDDIDMSMTHILRGDDHINNTPRQINIFEALSAKLPMYGHVPMILGSDGKRLSKRHGAVSVMQYREDGFFPEALNNYLVRLGWSHGDQEIFSVGEMIDYFDAAHINRSPAVFNPEKLLWLNAQYMKTLPLTRVKEDLLYHYQKLSIDVSAGLDLARVIETYRERAQTLVELATSTRYLFEKFDSYDEKAAKKAFKESAVEPLQAFKQLCESMPEWTAQGLHDAMHKVVAQLDIGFGKLGQPLRVAVTGGSMSPPMNEVMALLSRRVVLARIERALLRIRGVCHE